MNPVPGRLVHAVAFALAVLVFSGCGSHQSLEGAGSPVQPQSPSSPSSTTAAWVTLRDGSTGIRFSLPHKVRAQSKSTPSSGVRARLYEDKIGDVELAVTILGFVGPLPANYQRTVYDQIVSGLSQAGATDAHLSAVRPARVAGGKALDATLSFTATDGARNYWRMRTITEGQTMIQIQALTFSDPGRRGGPRKVDVAFSRLTRSVVVG